MPKASKSTKQQPKGGASPTRHPRASRLQRGAAEEGSSSTESDTPPLSRSTRTTRGAARAGGDVSGERASSVSSVNEVDGGEGGRLLAEGEEAKGRRAAEQAQASGTTAAGKDDCSNADDDDDDDDDDDEVKDGSPRPLVKDIPGGSKVARREGSQGSRSYQRLSWVDPESAPPPALPRSDSPFPDQGRGALTVRFSAETETIEFSDRESEWSSTGSLAGPEVMSAHRKFIRKWKPSCDARCCLLSLAMLFMFSGVGTFFLIADEADDLSRAELVVTCFIGLAMVVGGLVFTVRLLWKRFIDNYRRP